MMRFITRLTLAALVLVSVLAAASIPARAQGDSPLSADEQALLDRVFVARDVQNGYANYHEDATVLYVRDTVIVYQGETQTQQQVSDLTRTAVYVQTGDTRDFSATVTAIETATRVQDGQEDVDSVTIDADAIYVDGTLYVSAAYAEPNPDLPVLAEGWIVVDDPDADEILSLLELGDLVEDSALFDDEDLVRSAATSVTIEPGTTEDGTAVDVITVGFDGPESVLAVMAGSPEGVNPTVEAILSVASEAGMALSVSLDADNNALEVNATMLIAAEGVDGHTLSPDQLPEGVTLDLRFDQQQTQAFSDVNAEIGPITAPDVVTE
ncbi:hypothetical protein [Aggregatilinea lenta]|uniref:hypothetical protein n=1 Tax=Aggregatilinea lenta TaxID=913108 RepID=UPI000E5C1C8B|nr:hypothetical protein [Aggregatilinea lenta]